jgi:hypothetical protein
VGSRWWDFESGQGIFAEILQSLVPCVYVTRLLFLYLVQLIVLQRDLCPEGKNTGKTTSSTLKITGIAIVYWMIRIPRSRQVINKMPADFSGHFALELCTALYLQTSCVGFEGFRLYADLRPAGYRRSYFIQH